MIGFILSALGLIFWSGFVFLLGITTGLYQAVEILSEGDKNEMLRLLDKLKQRK